jgi:hypothetical protein
MGRSTRFDHGEPPSCLALQAFTGSVASSDLSDFNHGLSTPLTWVEVEGVKGPDVVLGLQTKLVGRAPP